MYVSTPAPHVNEDFIQIQINKAFAGMHTLIVKDNLNRSAQLKGNVYTFSSGIKEYSGIRTHRAASKIFTELINKHQWFQVDDVVYSFGRGTWRWYSTNNQ
ncbi:hypothetical protein [Aquimarina litoralis]|uniref:hypothetical protein n=1 Tax=Aquimarina litoralis TaxID=584605 RepID=UPI001C564DCA|nr:hypothetical protein [Aquimarina litoralis]MBW1297828.1 hypothetical protein [Aquimarina litoralis]